MIADPLGDSALILRELSHPAYEVAAAIQAAQIPGVLEAVASYETVGVYFDPDLFHPDSLSQLNVPEQTAASVLHEIPVCYEIGEDLDDVAKALGLSREAVVGLHTSVAYRCFAVGFCPGFAYLGYLPDGISGLPRRPAPRVRVEPGSVAITGRQTGVYPLERPGGWSILGKTPLYLVDVESAYFPIKAGDEVRFVSIVLDEFHRLKGKRL